MPLTTKERICQTCGADRRTTKCPDCGSYRAASERIREQLLAIPLGNYNGFNRYDTDDENVLHVWHDGRSFDIRTPKASYVSPVAQTATSTTREKKPSL